MASYSQAAYLRELKKVQLRFQNFRKGIRGRAAPDQRILDQIQVPDLRAVDLFENKNVTQWAMDFAAGVQDKIRLEDVQDVNQMDQWDRPAWFVYRAMAQTFTRGAVEFKLAGTLGYGGNGLVVRYDQLDKDDRVISSVAVKRGLNSRSNAGLRVEEAFMKVGQLCHICPPAKYMYKS